MAREREFPSSWFAGREMMPSRTQVQMIGSFCSTTRAEWFGVHHRRQLEIPAFVVDGSATHISALSGWSSSASTGSIAGITSSRKDQYCCPSARALSSVNPVRVQGPAEHPVSVSRQLLPEGRSSKRVTVSCADGSRTGQTDVDAGPGI